MTVITKLIQGLKRPDQIRPYLDQQRSEISFLMRRGEYGRVVQRLSEQFLGTNLFWHIILLKLKLTGRYSPRVKKRVFDFDLLLDPTDVGISRELLMYGNRELISTHHYRSEILDVEDLIEGSVTVIDVGANIGYYAMMPADLLEDVKVFAVEASEENSEILNANVELNGFQGKFEIDNVALDNQSGESILQIPDHSNWHRIGEDPPSDIDDIVTEESVDMVTFDGYIASKGIDPKDVDVIRMYIEGYETEVIQGMRNFLKRYESSVTLFIELHTGFFEDESELKEILSIIDTGNYEIVSVARSGSRFESVDVTDLQELHGVDLCIELILRYTGN